jgi:hypothetical protein
MAFSGDPALWADTFRDDLIPEILDLVVDSWGTFPKQQPSAREVPITRRFYVHLRSQKNVRELPFSIWTESEEPDPITGEPLGRIDIRLTHGYRENVYFALECKRLNVVAADGRRSSLAGEYVEQGMDRFVTGKYAGGLDKGGMLGYVMDGQIDDAIAAVTKAIEARRTQLKMDKAATLSPSSLRPGKNQVKETHHHQKDKPFTIHHVFVPVV